MVRRTGRGAESAHLLNQVAFQLRRGNQRFGFLIQIGLVGRTAALGDTEEFVFVTVGSIKIDLRRQVSPGVDLFIHIQGRVLRVAQVILDIGVIDPLRQRRFIAAAGPDALALFTGDDCGTGILAGRQNAFGRDIGVTQELQGDVFVVFTGFRVVKDIGDLLLVRRAQHEGSIVKSVLCQKGQRLRFNLQDFLAGEFGDRDVVTTEEIILGVILFEGERILINKRFIRHCALTYCWADYISGRHSICL